MPQLSTLTSFVDRLDEAGLHYTLESVREGAILVAVTVPDERWEIEFMDDGDIEIEVFRTDGEIYDFSIIDDLFEKADDDEDD